MSVIERDFIKPWREFPSRAKYFVPSEAIGNSHSTGLVIKIGPDLYGGVLNGTSSTLYQLTHLDNS
jgi:hypothetical protein